MYEEFFGLTCRPFQITPDPEFLYLSKTHRKAMNYLNYGIQENTGFILITGEIGSGKTTLVRKLLKNLPEGVRIARINNTRVDYTSLLAMINEDFGIESRGRTKAELFRDLNEFLIREYADGKHCVLIIDEAQNLTRDVIEEVRLLSNLETDKSKLLQIMLVGQPELREILADASLDQFTQRITIACHIRPLMLEETEEYIVHRLTVAGNPNAVKFEPGVIREIFEYSCGIPRIINVVCEWALLSAFSDGTKLISLDLVRDIAQEITSEHLGGRKPGEKANEKKPVNLDAVSKELADLKERFSHIETLVGGLGLALLEKLLEVPEKQYGNVEAAASLKRTLMNLINREQKTGDAAEKDVGQNPETGQTGKGIPLKLVKPDDG